MSANDSGEPGQERSTITIDVHHLIRSSWATWGRPRIVVDEGERKATWGQNELSVEPGEHHVHVYVRHVVPRKLGPAEVSVSTRPDSVAELEYFPPLWPFLDGSLGPPPQKANGSKVTLWILGAGVALFCLGLALSVTAFSAG
ncbi:hypothetical protein EF847_09500 [Actinobacteria bacterium YIM 96077]|uniref:Uncharacterized protein n=1 Tax=Phytoactinopolyspora halophila TaxID=1981511 RepID=A0A329QBC8_9ACTN|nr:hypothetical protein [Phytoactinopolyspora halophila]AYY12903.1 hypothetical protein EF847_09500 [Actinobacteria bacterium YIM 96077]RAW09301.1 hypothetical protein DPM12_21850 [Phytoactinopolyspora halophila]